MYSNRKANPGMEYDPPALNKREILARLFPRCEGPLVGSQRLRAFSVLW
jgi:hypothetical protein